MLQSPRSGGKNSDEVIGFFQLAYSFQPHYGPGALRPIKSIVTQPLTEMSTKNIPGAKEQQTEA
jgi:hypothetical protein